MTMVNRTCKCGCGKKFQARLADVRRGWGVFFSKACKAREQESRTGQYSRYQRRCRQQEDGQEGFQMSQGDLAFGGYGDADENSPFGDGKY